MGGVKVKRFWESGGWRVKANRNLAREREREGGNKILARERRRVRVTRFWLGSGGRG